MVSLKLKRQPKIISNIGFTNATENINKKITRLVNFINKEF